MLCVNASAMAAMYTIKNPAEKINNPADKMYNPATEIKNPAANIYNPATRINDPNPQSPPTQSPASTTTKTEILVKEQPPSMPTPDIPQKSYNLKTAKAYINAAKKAFTQDDYIEFLSITEDALRRISVGTLKASKKSKQKLAKFKKFGYGLLEQDEE
jgi:hypothetical protein